MLTVSHSELAAWARCPRRWFLSYYLQRGRDPQTAPATGTALLGTRLHLALEAWEGYNLNALAVLDWIYKDALHAAPAWETELLKERDMAFAMLESFLEWAAETGYDCGYQVVATERETSVYLPFLHGGGEFRLIAKLDVVVRRLDDGAILFRDYKSVGTLSKANRLPRSTQMKTYSMIQALQAKDDHRVPRPDGGQYVMLLRSKRTARAKPPFNGIETFAYNRHDLNSAWMRVRQLATEVRDARLALDAGTPHQMTARYVEGDDCDWACSFVSICHMLDDGSRWEDSLAEFPEHDPYARYRDTAMQDVLSAFRPGRNEEE